MNGPIHPPAASTAPQGSPTAAPQAPHGGYRAEIDGLRAVAVLAVILNHIDRRLLPCGQLGVDVFFVISGVVITLSLLRQQAGHRSARQLLLSFYARRIRRLLPALLASVLIGALLTLLFHPQPLVSLRTGLAALFGVSNLYLLRQSTDYFAAAADRNVFTHTWSLGVEEQFYLLFPWLLLWCGAGRRGAGGRRRLGLLVAGLSAASLLGFLVLLPRQPAAAYFLMPSRFWELGAGCLLALWLEGRSAAAAATPRWWQRLPAWPPLLLLLASLLLPTRLALIATLPAVAATVLLIAALQPGRPLQRLLSLRPLVAVGLLSYSLYLWHWIVLAISRWTIGIHPWTVPWQLAAMLLLAWGCHRWLELPLRRARWSPHPLGTLGIGVLLSAGGAALLLLLERPGLAGLYRGQRDAQLQLAPLGQLPADSLAAGSSWSLAHCVIGTDLEVGKPIDPALCTLPPRGPANGRTLLVLGNSTAVAQLESYVAFSRRGYAVRLVAGWGCPPVPSLVTRNVWSRSCVDYHQRVVPALLADLRPGDRVLLVNDLSPLSDPDPSGRLQGFDVRPEQLLRRGLPTRLPQRLEAVEADLDRLAAALNRRGIDLLIQTMGPLTRGLPDPSQCVPLFGAALPPLQSCAYSPTQAHRQARRSLQARLERLAARHGGVQLFDPLPWLCGPEHCAFIDRQGRLLFRDVAHVSERGARRLESGFSRLLQAGEPVGPGTGSPAADPAAAGPPPSGPPDGSGVPGPGR